MTICACGCGEPLDLGGRYRCGHSAARPVPPRYLIDESGCWVWQRFRNQGYGMFWRDGGMVPAHRVYYEERHGSCPATLDHLCRNRACVNPDHLEPCSRGENVRRGDVALLDWDKVAEIRATALAMECSQREQARRLAPIYNVTERAIRNVLRGERWPESERPSETRMAA